MSISFLVFLLLLLLSSLLKSCLFLGCMFLSLLSYLCHVLLFFSFFLVLFLFSFPYFGCSHRTSPLLMYSLLYSLAFYLLFLVLYHIFPTSCSFYSLPSFSFFSFGLCTFTTWHPHKKNRTNWFCFYWKNRAGSSECHENGNLWENIALCCRQQTKIWGNPVNPKS